MIDAALTGGGVVGAATQLAATAKTGGAIAATSTIMKYLTTTESGKSLVRAASKVEPTSPAMQKVFDKIYQMAPRILEGAVRNDAIPDLVSSAEAGTLDEAKAKNQARYEGRINRGTGENSVAIPQPKKAASEMVSVPNAKRKQFSDGSIREWDEANQEWVKIKQEI